MSRSFPPRPHLDSDRKRAKALKKAFALGSPEAFGRVRTHHPRFRDASDAELAGSRFRLSDAQLVVAREYGVESWPRLAALVSFLRSDFEERVELLLRAAVGDSPRRAHDLLARDPELARASLQTACAAGDEDAARRWIARDPGSVRRADGPSGALPLWTLCWSGLHLGNTLNDQARVQIAQELLRAGADPAASSTRESRFGASSCSALYGTVVRDQPSLTKILLEAGAPPDDGESMYHAAENASPRCLRLLLAHGAAIEGSHALLRALDKFDRGPIDALLEAGADPNELGPRGLNALHNAALRGQQPPVLDALLARGADLRAPDGSGRTALEIASRSGHCEAAAHLRERGAAERDSPVYRFVAACALGEAAEAAGFLSRGDLTLAELDPADLAVLPVAAEYGRKGVVELMLDLGFPVDAQGGDWRGTALNHAAHSGYPDLVELLLERGADEALPNEFGGTALGALVFASTSGDANRTFSPSRSEGERQAGLAACVELLVAAGARVDSEWLADASESVADALRRSGVTD